MKNTLRQASIALGLGGAIVICSRLLASSYLSSFLDDNLIILLLALTAINGSTVGIVVGKMSDIMARDSSRKFTVTQKALKAANAEQLLLVVLALAIEIAKHSNTLPQAIPHQALIIDAVLAACLIQSLQIVFDMLHSVFVLVDGENQ